MSTKRKWDQQAAPESREGESPAKISKTEDNTGKSATEAAAAAAAIAAKIAAQFAGPSTTSHPGSGSANGDSSTRDPHDADYTHDIEINDVRNRYMLTKGGTQQQVPILSTSLSLHDLMKDTDRYMKKRVHLLQPKEYGTRTNLKPQRKTRRYTFIYPQPRRKSWTRPLRKSMNS